MHLRLLARTPSSHPLFQRRTDLDPKRLRWNHSSDLHRRFKRSGPPATAYQAWGVYGMLTGVVESLSDHPINGEIMVSVSHGSYEITGSIEVFDPNRQSVVFETLATVERIAHDLSVDPYVTLVEVGLTVDLKEIQGGVEVE